MNLYQKYRPTIFSEVVGHEKVIKELQKRSKENSFPQVIYLTGESGVGKTTIARIIAKSIICENKDDEGNPCNECDFCKDILEEQFTLATREYNSSNLNIDAIREIASDAVRGSIFVNKKVFFIDELQELFSNKKAQKNLLKILEEETPYCHFILGSMDDSKVDKAIRNRSVMYRLDEIDYKAIGKYLYEICQKEKIELNQDQATILLDVAENSYGSLRTAIAYLERVIGSDLWDRESLVKDLGIVTEEKLVEYTQLLLEGDSDIFKYYITKDIAEKIRSMIVTTYKQKLGYEGNFFQRAVSKNLKKYPIELLNIVLDQFNEIYKYPYITKELMDYFLIQIIKTVLEETKRLKTPDQQSKKVDENSNASFLRRKPVEA